MWTREVYDNNMEDRVSSPAGFYRRRRGAGGRKLALDLLPEEKMAFRLMLEASQGYGMSGVREWLQQKFSSSELVEASQSSSAQKHSAMQSVITPKSVPDFVIPGTRPTTLNLTQPDNKEGLRTIGYDSLSSNNNNVDPFKKTSECSCRSEGIYSQPSNLSSPSSRCIRSVEELTGDVNVLLTSSDTTNDDPGSMAAVSLPHLRMYTPYGFTTLKESPNTRRKESLLMNSSSLVDLKRLSSHRSIIRSSSEYDQLPSPISSTAELQVPPGGHRRMDSTSSIASGSESTISESSPMCSWSSYYESRREYHRRRSSVQCALHTGRQSSPLERVQPEHLGLTREEAHSLAVLGEVKFSIVYDRKTSSLKLSIIKAEQLAKGLTQRQQLHLYIKSCLLPEKKHKYETKAVKGTHDPHFNEEFIFNDITLENIQENALRMRVYNRKALLGEIVLPLECLGLEHGEEVRMWRDLEPRASSHGCGQINLSLRFIPREEKLMVTVAEAKNLPRSVITGQPDPYVQILVRQNNQPEVIKVTRLRKMTRHPVFKQTFAFSISPRPEDLKYTCVQVRVMNKETLRSDNLIGELVLGDGATEEHETYHWLRIINTPGQNIQQWHELKQPTSE